MARPRGRCYRETPVSKQTKKKNEDFLKELDKDRTEKKCEYAVLVSLLEADSELTASASVNLNKLDIENVNLVAGDLLQGAPEYKLYDVIIIEGTVEFVPDSILKQLKPGGRLVTVLAKEKLGNIVVMHKGEKLTTTAVHYQASTQRLPEFVKPKGFEF